MLKTAFRLGTSSVALTTALLLAANTALAQVDLPPPGPVPAAAPGADEPGIETLTQGPIHEAFANPAEMDPTPGPVVAMQPPPEVTEDPPEFMPEGAIWISGYWVWDDDRDEFLWVTGVARVQPPGMRWVPGYFAEAEGGWQRVSGFWVSTEVPEVAYRPTAPPATLEAGPSSPAPADDHFWIPGSWNYYDTGYRWQAGYWAPYQRDWVWTPTRWVWSPGGYVHCPGYWDYRLAYRGQMFAPVHFQQPLYRQPGWTYRPWCVIPTNNLFIHMWVRPQWGCYYYGNYYDDRFANRGFVSWANIGVGRQRGYYDPFHSYAHVHYRRQGVDYLGRVQGWHNHYARNDDLRPQRTWREQQQTFGRGGRQALETQLVARQLTEVARRDDTAVRLTRLDEQAQRNQRQQVERSREFNNERSRIEHTARQTAGRLPDRTDRPGEGRDSKGRDDDRGRDDRGRGDGKAGSPLVDRVEGKTGRDNRDAADRPGRDGPKLTIPKDLPGGRSVVRTQPGNDDRPGRDQNSPPPRPRPTSQAGNDNNNDARPGRGDRQTQDGAKGAQENDRGSKTGNDRGANTTNDRGPKTDNDRGPKTEIDRGPKTESDRGPKAEIDRGPKAEIDRGPKTNNDRGPKTDNDRGPKTGNDRGPKTDNDRGPKTDNDRGPNTTNDRGPKTGNDRGPKTEIDRGPKTNSDRGPKIDIDRSPKTDNDRGTKTDNDRRGPAANRGENADRQDTGKARTIPQVDRPGRSGETPRGPDLGTPSGATNRPRTAPLVPRGNAGEQPNPPRNNPSENRGKSESPRGSSRADAPPDRIESPRPNVRAEAPAPMPRVEPRPESRPMPRVEAPRESRPMPRVETPRENQPAPRVETPRPTPRAEAPRPTPRAEAPRPTPRAEAARPTPRAEAPRPTPRAETPRPNPGPDRGSNPSRPPQADRPDSGNNSANSSNKGNNDNKRRARDND